MKHWIVGYARDAIFGQNMCIANESVIFISKLKFNSVRLSLRYAVQEHFFCFAGHMSWCEIAAKSPVTLWELKCKREEKTTWPNSKCLKVETWGGDSMIYWRYVAAKKPQIICISVVLNKSKLFIFWNLINWRSIAMSIQIDFDLLLINL